MLAHSRGEKNFPTHSYNAPANVDVKEVRSNLHLTQEEFASFIGASVHAVKLMRATVGNSIGVKASGGIRTRESALEMIKAGASRLGTSATSAILAG
jgi:deoxyribose-phosphate aldolase